MIDNLEEAKRVLIFDGDESKEEVAAMAQLAQARALIALVERIDRLTIHTSHEGNITHSLDVEISETVGIELSKGVTANFR